MILNSIDTITYILKTHLLDSYYCLPERPDMAFTFLWKCMNNIYSTYQRKNSTDDTRNSISDSALLEFIAYIGVFGQECRSSTGHFCNEIF